MEMEILFGTDELLFKDFIQKDCNVQQDSTFPNCTGIALQKKHIILIGPV